MEQLSHCLSIIKLFTYPISRSISFVFVKDDIKNHQNEEGGIVRDDGSRAGKLSSIHHIQPGAEDDHSWNAVKRGLKQQKYKIERCQWVFLGPIP